MTIDNIYQKTILPRSKRNPIAVGQRVTSQGRKHHGTVIAIIQPTCADGTPMSVAVRWDNKLNIMEAWATNELTIVEQDTRLR